jgi:hypothetical protein
MAIMNVNPFIGITLLTAFATRPDFICKEQKSGEEITIEITYASGIKEGKKFKIEEERLFSVAVEASTIIQEKLINPPTGMYVSKTTVRRDVRDRPSRKKCNIRYGLS